MIPGKNITPSSINQFLQTRQIDKQYTDFFTGQ